MSSRFDLRALRDRDELMAVGKEISAEIKADDVPSLAAAVSFKIVLALFPALAAVIGIFGLRTEPEELEKLLQNLTGALPEGVVLPASVVEFFNRILIGLIDSRTAGIALVVGVLGGLWAASSAAVTLNKALTRAFDETDDRKLVGSRGVALVVTVALLVALIAISVLLVAGSAIEDRILGGLPLTETAGAALDAASTLGRYVAAIVLLMVLFAFIYWIGPDYERRPTWAWITPGAALAVVTWLVASAAFGWYVATLGRYTGEGSIYGPLGSAIVFMLWLQLSMFALLLGAEVNQVLAVRARRRRSGDDADAGSVGTVGDDGERGDATAGRASAARSDPAPATGGLRAATTPTRGRAGTHRRSAAARTGPDGNAGAIATADGSSSVDRGRADGLRVRDAHDDGRSVATRRPVPAVTVVGAAVAAVSSLVGLTGLLRRLKG